MNKVRAAKMILSLGGSQGVIVPSVATSDTGVVTITLEGSPSMYDPVQIMSEVLNRQGQTIEVNILPLGSSAGKESYSDNQIDFILSSIDERKEAKTNFYSIVSEITDTKEGDRRQVYFAQDPLVFVFKKDPTCKQQITYKPLDLDKFLTKGEENGNGDWKGNRSELIKIFTDGTGNFSECNFGSFIREGGSLRSNLNKAFLMTPSKGLVEGLLNACAFQPPKQQAFCEILEASEFLETRFKNYLSWPDTDNTNSGIVGLALPENNWLALERFKRSAPQGSATFFPRSFYDANSAMFDHPDLEIVLAQDPITEDDKSQIDPNDSNVSAMNIGRAYKNVFKRKFYLQFKPKNGEGQSTSISENLQTWVKNLFLFNVEITNKLELAVPKYLEKVQQSEGVNQNNKTVIETKPN